MKKIYHDFELQINKKKLQFFECSDDLSLISVHHICSVRVISIRFTMVHQLG